MKTEAFPRGTSRLLIILGLTLCAAGNANAQGLAVISSGAFQTAYRELVPAYERARQSKIVTLGGSTASATAIQTRLERGEDADVVILADDAIAELIRRGKVMPESRVQLVRSSIGMAVRTGTPKPNISSIEALKQTLLRARSIAYSIGPSGVYLSSELFPSLGIAEALRTKSKEVSGEPVGAVVARGEAEVGFQQLSELLQVSGIELVGPLPPGAQRITVYSAGVVVGAKRPDEARDLIKFFASSVASIIQGTGLEALTTQELR